MGFIHAGEFVVQRGQAHSEHEAMLETRHQLKVCFGQRTACEDANVQCGVITDQLQPPPYDLLVLLGEEEDGELTDGELNDLCGV